MKIYDGVHITKAPRQDKGEDVMTVSYDKGFCNDKSCLLVGHNSKGDLYIENEFTGHEADVLYMLLKKEKSIQELQEQIPKWHMVADGDLPTNDDNRFYLCISENHEEDLPTMFQYDSELGFGWWNDIYDVRGNFSSKNSIFNGYMRWFSIYYNWMFE